MHAKHVIACGLSMLFLGVFSVTAAPSDVADAAMKASKAGVRTLIQQKADVNAAQVDGSTALHWAARWDDLEMVEMLIAAGAKPGMATRLGITPLALACINGNASIIERLLRAGVDPDAPVTSNGETALMMAARTGKLDPVKVLLDNGADVNMKEPSGGSTALMWAAAEEHPEVVRLLVARGADVNLRSKIIVPRELPATIEQMPPPCSEILQPPARCTPVGAAAPPPPPPTNPETDRRRTGALTPLIFSARQGDLESTRLLLGAGANVNATAADGSAALQVAIQNGHYELASFLMDSGADVNHSEAIRGMTPLYLAVHFRNIEREPTEPIWAPDNVDALTLIEKLLVRGADPNQWVKSNSPRGWALQNASWLQEAGATPFIRAAMSGDITGMRLLLKYGANPHLVTADKTTALMASSGIGWMTGVIPSDAESIEAIKLLLDLGVDVNAVNDDGRTALHGAAYRGSNGAVQVLVDAGARMDIKDNGNKDAAEGLTPLDFALGARPHSAATTYVPQPHTEALLRKLMTERGVPIVTASECALKGFNCGDRDPKLPQQ